MTTVQVPTTNRQFLELAKNVQALKQENLELHQRLRDAQKSMEAMLRGVQEAASAPMGDEDKEQLRFFRAREPHIQGLLSSVAASVGVKRAMDSLRRFTSQWVG